MWNCSWRPAVFFVLCMFINLPVPTEKPLWPTTHRTDPAAAICLFLGKSALYGFLNGLGVSKGKKGTEYPKFLIPTVFSVIAAQFNPGKSIICAELPFQILNSFHRLVQRFSISTAIWWIDINFAQAFLVSTGWILLSLGVPFGFEWNFSSTIGFQIVQYSILFDLSAKLITFPKPRIVCI